MCCAGSWISYNEEELQSEIYSLQHDGRLHGHQGCWQHWHTSLFRLELTLQPVLSEGYGPQNENNFYLWWIVGSYRPNESTRVFGDKNIGKEKNNTIKYHDPNRHVINYHKNPRHYSPSAEEIWSNLIYPNKIFWFLLALKEVNSSSTEKHWVCTDNDYPIFYQYWKNIIFASSRMSDLNVIRIASSQGK